MRENVMGEKRWTEMTADEQVPPWSRVVDEVALNEALEPAARALYEHSTAGKDALPWDDDNWNPDIKETWFDGARAVLAAAPRPVIDREEARVVAREAIANEFSTWDNESSPPYFAGDNHPAQTMQRIADPAVDAVLALINGSES